MPSKPRPSSPMSCSINRDLSKQPSRPCSTKVRSASFSSTYFQSGGMVDAVLNLGLAAPIDVQVGGSNLERSHETAVELASEIQRIPGVADVYIPQDVDYPALKLDIDRTRAGEL